MKKVNKKILYFCLSLSVLVGSFFVFGQNWWLEKVEAQDELLAIKKTNLESLMTGNLLATEKVGWSLGTVDLGGDGQSEIVLGSSAGEKPVVEIIRSDGSLINSFFAYGENFRGGVRAKNCDINQDSRSEILTVPRAGGGPHVRIFDGYGRPVVPGFFAFEEGYTDGIDATCLNLSKGQRQVVVVVGGKEKKEVRIFDVEGKMISSFGIGLKSDNVKISRIDLGGDGQDEIVVAGGFGEKSLVEIYRSDGSLVNSFLAFDEKFSGGLSLAVGDLDQDQKEEIVIVPEFLGGSHLRVFDGYGQEKMTASTFLVERDFLGGFDIAVGSFGQNKKEILSLVQNLPTGREDLYKYIAVDVSDQTFKCYENGFLVCDLITSTGKPATPTKIGEFDAFAKYEMAYGGADGQRWSMPYFISFYKVGNIENGIHELPFLNGRREGEGSLGQAVSHGCVRLGIGDAKKVYDWLEVNKTKVIVTR